MLFEASKIRNIPIGQVENARKMRFFLALSDK